MKLTEWDPYEFLTKITVLCENMNKRIAQQEKQIFNHIMQLITKEKNYEQQQSVHTFKKKISTVLASLVSDATQMHRPIATSIQKCACV